MGRSPEQRYGDIAVIFHWLIALFIVGLLVIGKYMTGLEENDPVRFALTQWHKSFGITVLLLSVLRLLWRFTHKPPPELEGMPKWQSKAASGAHALLYLLMFGLPVTGWIMVSASPLNLNTVLFNLVPLPHLPFLEDSPNRADIAAAFHEIHEIASTVLILILIAHIGAALKHHFFDKDTTMLRMLPDWSSAAFKSKLLALFVALGGASAGLYLYADSSNTAALLAAGDSEVSFVADVTGEATPGVFTQSSVDAVIDLDNPGNSAINARVQTASISSENAQVEGSLPDEEWFDVENHPEALFVSSSVDKTDDGQLMVNGDLTIKTTTQQVSFPMSLSDEEGKQVARGEFAIDRREFNIGLESQANEDFVGFQVTIKFRFDIALPDS